MSLPKVIVVDTSPLQRMVISNVVKDGNMQVVGTAGNGKEAVELFNSKEADIIVTAVNMPQYNAKYLVSKLLAKKKVPILLVCGVNDDFNLVNECISLGAVDFIEKPDGGNFTSMNAVKDQILSKIRETLRLNIQSNSSGDTSSKAGVTVEHVFPDVLNYDALCIGSSTGGPSAVETLIKNLPGNLPIPVVISQHMPQRFIKTFAERLDTITPLKVQVASMNERLENGVIYVAQGIGNPWLKKSLGKVRLSYINEQFPEFNNPSVNSLMHSAADVYRNKLLAVILTGMGKDGMEGCETVKKHHGCVIVQDEKTSVVFGMPKAVVDKGYADHVVSISQMGQFIVSCL